MLTSIFKTPKPIIGKVQLLPLPGSPRWDGQWDALVSRAEQEAAALATGGVDGLILENYYDTPYSTARMDMAGAIAMASLVKRIQQFTYLPVGIAVREHDPETALAIAVNTQASFMRLSILTGALLSHSGVINSNYAQLLQYQSRLKAKLPPLLVNISLQQINTALSTQSDAFTQLLALARTVASTGETAALVLDSQQLPPAKVQELKQQIAQPLLVEYSALHQSPASYYDVSDGLILEAGIRKSELYTDLPQPTIDVSQVEEQINNLRKVLSVEDMDPDVFLTR